MYVEVFLDQTQFTVSAKIPDTPSERYSTQEEGYLKFLACIANWQRRGMSVRIGVRALGSVEKFVGWMDQAGVPVVIHHFLDFKSRDRTGAIHAGKKGFKRELLCKGTN